MENLSTRLLHSTQGTIFRAFVLCNGIYYTFSSGSWQVFTYPDILVECDQGKDRTQTIKIDLPFVQETPSSDAEYLYDFPCGKLQYDLDVWKILTQSYNERVVLHMCDHSYRSDHLQLVWVSHPDQDGTYHLHNDVRLVS